MKRLSALLNVRFLARSLNVHPVTLYRLVEQGKIPFIKLGRGRIRFEAEAIGAWIEQKSFSPIAAADSFPQVELSLANYDKLFLLKGGVKVSPKGKIWRYPFGSVILRLTKSGMERWYIYYRVQGKRVREVVRYAQGRADALKVLVSKVGDAFRRRYGFPLEKKKDALFEDFGKEFLELYSRVHWRPKTVQGHENSLQHLNRFFRGKRLSDVTPESTARYIAERSKKVSRASVNRELSCLKCMLNRGVEWGRLDANPIVRVRKFKEPEPKDRILAGEELGRLLQACASHLKPILITALCTGMRRSEILSLKWGQVDLGKRMIRVERTKSGKARVIPISSVLMDEFSRLKRTDGKSDYVFLDPANRRPMKDIKTAFRSACARAKKNPDDKKDPGIVGLRFHDLRHNAASKMVEAGIDLVTVSKILGHASIQTTMRYTHPTPENMRRAVETLAQNVASAQDFVPILSTKKEGVPASAFVSADYQSRASAF